MIGSPAERRGGGRERAASVAAAIRGASARHEPRGARDRNRAPDRTRLRAATVPHLDLRLAGAARSRSYARTHLRTALSDDAVLAPDRD